MTSHRGSSAPPVRHITEAGLAKALKVVEAFKRSPAAQKLDARVRAEQAERATLARLTEAGWRFGEKLRNKLRGA